MNNKIIINRLCLIFKTLAKNPLSALRVILSLLVYNRLLSVLNFIHSTPDNTYYSPSSSWILNIFPDSLFIFDTNHFYYFKILIIVATLGTLFGVLGRINLIILSFLCLYLFGIRSDIGLFDHNLSLSCQIFFILALVPGSMKLSIDYFLFSYLKKIKNKTSTLMHNPNWGVNLILILLVFTYLTAGVSKLRYGKGLNWVDGNTLNFYLKQETVNKYPKGDYNLIIGNSKIKNANISKDKFGFEAHTYGNYQSSRTVRKILNVIIESKVIIIALSIGSLVFELFGFIVFVNSRYKNIYLISAIIFHFSIEVLMGVWFRSYVCVCFCLIDWEEILRNLNFKNLNLVK